MPEHNHITRGDVTGCPSCDVREGRAPDPMRIPVEPERDRPVAPGLSEFPEVQHRIEGGRFVCPGDENSRCHRYPGCDGEHEYWPCGCEYVGHAECWIVPWIEATALSDNYHGNQPYFLNKDFPDGDVAWTWEGDYVAFAYVHESTDSEPS